MQTKCDSSGSHSDGHVKHYLTGNGNVINLCLNCWAAQNLYNYNKAAQYNDHIQFPQRDWYSAEIHETRERMKIYIRNSEGNYWSSLQLWALNRTSVNAFTEDDILNVELPDGGHWENEEGKTIKQIPCGCPVTKEH